MEGRSGLSGDSPRYVELEIRPVVSAQPRGVRPSRSRQRMGRRLGVSSAGARVLVNAVMDLSISCSPGPAVWSGAQMDWAAQELIDEGVMSHEGDSPDRSAFRIGLGACSVSSGVTESAQRLRHHIDTHTACWGAAVTLNQVVWKKLVDLQFDDKRLRKLDIETIALLRLADKVRFFLVMLGGVRPHLDVQDGELWDCLDEGWKFPEERNALADRLAALRELHSEKAERLSDHRLRRLNRFILILTIVGTIAAAGSIVTFVQQEPDVREWLCDLPGPPGDCEAPLKPEHHATQPPSP